VKTYNNSLKPTAHACHALCGTERTEHSEFTNEMSSRAHEAPKVTNNGKARATLRQLNSMVLHTQRGTERPDRTFIF